MHIGGHPCAKLKPLHAAKLASRAGEAGERKQVAGVAAIVETTLQRRDNGRRHFPAHPDFWQRSLATSFPAIAAIADQFLRSIHSLALVLRCRA